MSSKGPIHYLRTTNPLNPENLAVYPTRLPTNRPNPYTLPGPLRQAAHRAAVLRDAPLRQRPAPVDLQHAARRSSRRRCPTLSLPVEVPPLVPDAGVVDGLFSYPDQLIADILKFAFPSGTGVPGVAPPCTQQPKFDVSGEQTQFPHLKPGAVMAEALHRVVRAAARRPRAVLAVLAVLCAAGAALALGLQPSAATSTLAGRSSDTYQATERYRERFGDHAIVVLVRGPLEQLVLTENLGRLLGLEGCLSGNKPADQAAPGGERGPCAELARTKPVQVVYGPGTFINSAVGEIQDQLQDRLDVKGAEAEKAAAAARGLARRQGKSKAEQDRLARSAEQLVYAEFVRDLLALNLKYGLGVDETPRLDDPDFVSTLVFDPSRGATTPKARFAYLFPSSESAAIQVRLKPGLSDAERERATALVRAAVRMPDFALRNADGYTVTGVPVLAEDLSDALAGSVARLLLVAVVVMAAVLALVFRRRLRLVPLAVALGAVALTFGLMALVGAPLTMASIAVLPVLLGLGVDYAIQYQARIDDPPTPDGGRARRAGRPADDRHRGARDRGRLPRAAALAGADGARLRRAARRRRRRRLRLRADRRDRRARRARPAAAARPARSRARRAGRASCSPPPGGRRRGWRARPGGWGRRVLRRGGRAPRARAGGRARRRGARLGRRHADRGALGPPGARAAGPAGGARPRHAAAHDRRGRRGRRRRRGARPGRPGGRRVDARVPGSACCARRATRRRTAAARPRCARRCRCPTCSGATPDRTARGSTRCSTPCRRTSPRR